MAPKDDIIVGGLLLLLPVFLLAVEHMKIDTRYVCPQEATRRLLFVLFALGFLCVS